jgi:rRNA maturation RNase YbeY
MTLSIRNRQRVRRINTALLRRITLHLLGEHFHIDEYELAIHLVAAPEMARVNWNFLKHKGSTDIITFNHSEELFRVSGFEFRVGHDQEEPEARNPKHETNIHGELFICLDDAVKQAREFRTIWPGELVRYVIHGLLHLRGHDDLKPAARRLMKREENRLLNATAATFNLSQLQIRNAKPKRSDSWTKRRQASSSAPVRSPRRA